MESPQRITTIVLLCSRPSTMPVLRPLGHRVTAAVELGLAPQTRLARDDQARRDRVAVPRTLIELQYLEQREGRRAKRRTAQSAGRAPADVPVAAASVAEPTDVWWAGPPQTSWGGSQSLALAARKPRRQQRRAARTRPSAALALDCLAPPLSAHGAATRQSLLAKIDSLDTMSVQAGVGYGATQLPPTPGTAHGERSPTSWFGRLITPLIRALKAANIM